MRLILQDYEFLDFSEKEKEKWHSFHCKLILTFTVGEQICKYPIYLQNQEGEMLSWTHDMWEVGYIENKLECGYDVLQTIKKIAMGEEVDLPMDFGVFPF